MSYRLEKDNPYDGRKITLSQCAKSFLSGILVCAIVFTASMRIKIGYSTQKTKETYSKSISYYHDMVTEVADFFKENGVKNPEECFELYVKLLWNGYFSVNTTYDYKRNTDNLIGYFGLKVMTGQGDCKNNEDFFCKIMTELGYLAYQTVCTCYVNEDNLSLVDRVFGNHVITVVLYHGTEYYFDTTNLCVYEKQDVNYAFSEDNNLNVVLKPIISYMCCYQDLDEMAELFYLQFTGKSGEDYVVNDSLEDTELSKVLVLENKIKNSVREISDAING